MTNDISTLLLDAAILLIVGMSVVFVFLTILIFAIHAIEWISNQLPSEQPTTATFSANQAVSASQSTSGNATENGVFGRLAALATQVEISRPLVLVRETTDLHLHKRTGLEGRMRQ